MKQAFRRLIAEFRMLKHFPAFVTHHASIAVLRFTLLALATQVTVFLPQRHPVGPLVELRSHEFRQQSSNIRIGGTQVMSPPLSLRSPSRFAPHSVPHGEVFRVILEVLDFGVEAENAPPTVVILSPVSDGVYYSDQKVILSTQVSDDDDSAGVLLCAAAL